MLDVDELAVAAAAAEVEARGVDGPAAAAVLDPRASSSSELEPAAEADETRSRLRGGGIVARAHLIVAVACESTIIHTTGHC